jgi:hypothetical protein
MRNPTRLASRLAALLLALAAATAEAQAEQLRFEVRMRADYTADWRQRSRDAGERCKGWTEGDGYLRGRVRSTDPATIEVEKNGRRWYGSGGSFEHADGSFSSHFAVKVHPFVFQTAECSPCGMTELGECEPTPRDYDLVGGCKERKVRNAWVTAGVGPKGGAAGSAGIPLPNDFARCGRWPQNVLDGLPPSNIENFRFTWADVAPKLAKLGVRDQRTFTDTAQEGDCAKKRSRAEFRVCERWSMDLEFVRVPR